MIGWFVDGHSLVLAIILAIIIGTPVSALASFAEGKVALQMTRGCRELVLTR